MLFWSKGVWSQKEIADAFVAWMKSKPIDIGSTVRKGIRTYMTKGTLGMPRNDWDAGNGAAMRMAPVAVYTLGDEELYERYTLEQAHLTHNHPLSMQEPCAWEKWFRRQYLLRIAFNCMNAPAALDDEQHPNFKFQNYRGNASGYIVDTLQTVFHYLFTTASFEECLVGIVNQGGDADTTGAIAA